MGLAKRGDMISICGFASLDWVLADFAITYMGAPSSLLYNCRAMA